MQRRAAKRGRRAVANHAAGTRARKPPIALFCAMARSRKRALVRAMTVMVRPHRRWCFATVPDNHEFRINILNKILFKKVFFWLLGFQECARATSEAAKFAELEVAP
jgi:predicted protein tyrosine phosphatase